MHRAERINDIMDLNLSSLGILPLVAPCRVLYATRHQIYLSCDMNDMVSGLVSHTDKQTQYTQGPTD